ncbi:MAG: flavodoxin, partial [Abditibacteriota bacterium]|nr:flavodoxin [Abditibacteriota bacterium]
LFEVDTVKPYSEDYMICIEEAKAELRNNGRPELKKMLSDISEYDNVFVCGPCWWGTYPCAVFTQLEALDFSGKNVFPLMTHEGSGLAGAPAALRKYCNGAEVGRGLAVKGSEASRSEKEVASWAASLV